MSDGLKQNPRFDKEASSLREGESSKDKPESRLANLSLAELMQEKGFFTKDRLQQNTQAKDIQNKGGLNELTSFDLLAGMGFIRSFSDNKSAEFKWQAAKSNFLELPKQFGRKFLQSKQAELRELKKLEEEKKEKEDFKRTDKRPLKKAEENLEDDEEHKVEEKEKEDKLKEPETDQEQEDEIAYDLKSEKIYDEKDYLEEIKRATELSLGIDEAHTKGVQVFKDLEQIHPQDMGSAVKAPARKHLSRKRLRDCIKNLSTGKVIVLGDLLIDELLEGSPERISREAPVLILEHVSTQLIPGGAANTAHNISALGGKCHAIGVCGKDEYAEKLTRLLDKHNITHDLIQDPNRPTTVKTRILSKSHAFQQQLLRLDRISHDTISDAIQILLVNKLEQAAGKYGAIILSDYRGGVITNSIIDACRKITARQNLLLVVDAQNDFGRFQGTTLLTPNQPDAEKAVGFEFDSAQNLIRGGTELLRITGAKAILITCGSKGMVLFQKGEAPSYLPAFNRSEVFDVTGAGDTVVATMTLALVTGSSFEEATALGNLAAGIVVKKPGTAVTNQEELTNSLEMVTLAEE